jgi:hypothetical protein
MEMNRELTGMTRPPVEEFRRLTRDLYVAAGDVSFWQGAYRDPAETEFTEVAALITARERLLLDVLYGDQHGGQRVISRFSILPRGDGSWFATVGRHWNVDRPDPRS